MTVLRLPVRGLMDDFTPRLSRSACLLYFLEFSIENLPLISAFLHV